MSKLLNRRKSSRSKSVLRSRSILYRIAQASHRLNEATHQLPAARRPFDPAKLYR